jgi:Endonuclease/Exonuclease/phosphatase family.
MVRNTECITEKIKNKGKYTIATWNIKSMSVGKLENVNQEMKIDILGVSELRWKSNGHFKSDVTTIYFSGNDSVKRNGVAILLNQKTERSLLGYKTVCGRIIYIRLKAYSVNITCIQVYAPTTDADTEEVEEYYQKLQQVLQEIPKERFPTSNE